MKIFRSKNGPFSERIHFDLDEIDKICAAELAATDLLPADPCPIRIDRFIEKRFNVVPQYLPLPDGLLGFTRFGVIGVVEVVVASAFDEEGTVAARRRLRATLAHEAGHALLHTAMLIPKSQTGSLFADGESGPEVMCRDILGGANKEKYDGRWWEFQANKAIGALLMPRRLVAKAAMPYLETSGDLAQLVLGAEREAAVRQLSALFDVNPVVARLRLGELYPDHEERGQKTI
jgi:hypothetical protein